MSEPKLITPLLDNFAMGDPISDINGVRRCPAMQNDSGDKYIVKIISIPPSKTQLDALILSGAYSSAESANEYFKTLADDVVKEATVLEKLSRLEGFSAPAGCQVHSEAGDTGFDVYLLSPYQTSLAHQLRHGSMTHLAALNLALDICAALQVCRRSGYLYVDLKPENIYVQEGRPSKIGEIGFLNLNSLRFASLPDRYRSAYTAPEIVDAFASLNTTVDVYALGLILYQIFNDGLLPTLNAEDPDADFPPPAYADYEMAEIIMKACKQNPDERWKDPTEMGQALVSYMQRNGAHDTPIVPTLETTPAIVDDITEDTDSAISEEEQSASNISESVETIEQDIPSEESISEDAPEVSDSILAETQSCAETQLEDIPDAEQVVIAVEEDNETTTAEIIFDETLPEESVEEVDYAEVSNEVSDMLMQVDDLVSHPTPDPVVAPDPIEVPIPAPLPTEPETECETQDSDNAEEVTDSDSDIPVNEAASDIILDLDSEDIDADSQHDSPRSKFRWLRNIVVVLFVIAIASVGILFYTKYYLQPIDSIVLQEHENGDLTVLVSSPVDESKLVVICSDTYGNKRSLPVVNGKAEFTGLSPNSAYKISISISGFHRLTGDTSAAFTTPAQTNIVQFRAVTGSEDGSVILSFTVDGPDSAQWQVKYRAPEIPEQTATFTGHMHTLSGLTVGAEYEFILTPVTNLNYTGNNELRHTVCAIVKANNLRITSCLNGKLEAVWSVAEGAQVEGWTVRCYNDSGYDQTTTVTEPSVSFEGINIESAYTVEVTATGMSISERAYLAANSATISDFKADDSAANKIALSWNTNGYTPANGWLLLYTVDGSAAQEIAINPDGTAELTPKIPGATYTFTLQATDGTAVLGGELSLVTAKAKSFSGYDVTAKNMEFKMCKRPSSKNWDRHDLSSSDYTSTFKANEKASFLVHLNHSYNKSKSNITALYVIRDEEGSVVSAATTTSTWTKMWYRNYCELNIPAIPQSVGKYTISVYFNGALAHSQSFKVTA